MYLVVQSETDTALKHNTLTLTESPKLICMHACHPPPPPQHTHLGRPRALGLRVWMPPLPPLTHLTLREKKKDVYQNHHVHVSREYLLNHSVFCDQTGCGGTSTWPECHAGKMICYFQHQSHTAYNYIINVQLFLLSLLN